jgi:two-component system, OmpR family, phosphate regulon sensor histidine kinase PhoR
LYICIVKKNILILIAIITTFSVIGIITTQYIWVSRAINLRTEQFNDMIQFKLSDVVDQLYDFQKEKVIIAEEKSDSIEGGLNKIKKEIDSSRLVYSMIDSLLSAELGCFQNAKDFFYAIADTAKGEIIYCNLENNSNALVTSEHQVSLDKISTNKNLVLSVFFPDQKNIIVRKMFLWVQVLPALFLLIVIACFLYIIFTIIRQKKISEMKSDFVNNMTHEFKTPISTISVASEILMRPTIWESHEKIQKYANIIYDENLRLRNQVEQVLQISILDKNELKLQPAEIDIHPIIENSVDIFNMIVKEKQGEIVSELNATNSVIFVDELHFINVITNMLDNAIKYTDCCPKIKISTTNKNKGITIRVEDNGIGINAPDQKHIYKKFFRVHTGDVHNVKGFGLGLFYVKSVMDAHHGTIELVKSEISRGSVFELHFPFNFNINQNT